MDELDMLTFKVGLAHGWRLFYEDPKPSRNWPYLDLTNDAGRIQFQIGRGLEEIKDDIRLVELFGDENASHYLPEIMRARFPDWSRDWKAAGKLFEEMAESGDGLPDLNYVTGYVVGDMDALRYVLTMRMFSKWVYDYKNIIGIGKTGPEAISRAYLKWKEARE
jgi:hypothetical protein